MTERSIIPVHFYISQKDQSHPSIFYISQRNLPVLILKQLISCTFDAKMTPLVKDLLPVLVPIIHQIVNRSLTEKRIPTVHKKETVQPLLKIYREKDDLTNIRPVSTCASLVEQEKRCTVSNQGRALTY